MDCCLPAECINEYQYQISHHLRHIFKQELHDLTHPVYLAIYVHLTDSFGGGGGIVCIFKVELDINLATSG